MDKLKETWAKLPSSAKVFVAFVAVVVVLEIISKIPT
jgi:hypothetical protein